MAVFLVLIKYSQLFGVVSYRVGMVLLVQADVALFLWVWAVY